MRKMLLVLLLMLFSANVALADAVVGDVVITLGANLQKEQREQMLKKFNAPNAKIITVTNEEEYKYLGNLLSKEIIGTRAISCARIEMAPSGTGIVVETNNISWVTEAMYENALATAGLTDAKVMVDAPFRVSGTAALTGVMKAFETATGEKLDENRKVVANEELVTTAQIADKIGDKEKAAELLTRLKAELSKQAAKLTDDQLEEMIVNVSENMGLSLIQEEIDALVSLLRKIQALDIDWNKVLDQISSYKDDIQNFLNNNPEAKSLLQELLSFLQSFFAKVLNWLKS